MVKCTLDGKEIDVEPGTTILNAARAIAIDIPTFCYQDRLSLSASCRMCLIEIEGRRKLEPACATTVSENMVIHSRSDKVVTMREDMLEILLANHPLDCPVCDKGGECELQDTVFEYGKGESRFQDDKRVFRTRDIELNDVIVFNANRCIQCQRCVRICEEVVGDTALGTSERGLDSEITGIGNSLKDCSHCGNCIEVCPVGALMSTPYRYKARPWDMVQAETICAMCGTGCSLTVESRDGAVKRVKSKYETGINGELLCARGRFGIDCLEGGTPVRVPMIRTDGALVEASWGEAIALIATTAQTIKARNGTIQGQISPQQNNETAFAFQHLMRQAFHSDDIHSGSRFSGLRDLSPGATSKLAQLINTGLSRASLDTLLGHDCTLVLGANIAEENPVTGYLMRAAVRDQRTRLLIACSRPSNLDDIATAHLRLLPGEEARLLSALSDSGNTAPDNIATSDAAAQAGFLTTARAALDAAASLTLFLGTEFLRTGQIEETLDWILHTVQTLEKKGKTVAVQFLFDRPNQRGLWDMGCLPGIPPASAFAETALASALTETGPGGASAKTAADTTPASTVPAQVPDMVFVAGADPLTDCALGDRCGTAARKTDFLVVQSAHVNATTEHADVLLPSPAWGEEVGTFTSNQGATQPLQMIRPPAADVLSAATIYQRIATAMGIAPDWTDPPPLFTPQVALMGPNGAGPPPATSASALSAIPPAASTGKTYSTAARKPDAAPDQPPALPRVQPSKPGDRHYHLITGASLFTAGTISTRSHLLQDLERGTYLELNPPEGLDPDAHQYEVTLRSGSTTLNAPLKVNRGFAPGVVYAPEHMLTALENNPLSARDYPLAVALTFARLP
jgi:NADH-quinone oxidoreductase subunit G